ncbi:hypothetical protein DPT70_24100, partial [Salmonella enterica subsp. enterica]|nr:hypothetical protein [Salmonella enterica subsp. enterica]
MRKVLAMTSAAILMMAGAAFAQQADSPNADPNAADKQSPFSDQTMMGPFYTDNTMSTLRADAEWKAAWDAMTPEQQASLKAACQTNTNDK